MHKENKSIDVRNTSPWPFIFASHSLAKNTKLQSVQDMLWSKWGISKIFNFKKAVFSKI